MEPKFILWLYIIFRRVKSQGSVWLCDLWESGKENDYPWWSLELSEVEVIFAMIVWIFSWETWINVYSSQIGCSPKWWFHQSPNWKISECVGPPEHWLGAAWRWGGARSHITEKVSSQHRWQGLHCHKAGMSASVNLQYSIFSGTS